MAVNHLREAVRRHVMMVVIVSGFPFLLLSLDVAEMVSQPLISDSLFAVTLFLAVWMPLYWIAYWYGEPR